MSEDTEIIRYDLLVESALRGVVQQSLQQVAEHGLPGQHHFYITFNVHHPAVRMPDYLRAQYPQEMTIVLQYQFYGLEVDDESVSVTLSFNGQRERVTVPLAAITTFADPSVNFALQFHTAEIDEDEEGDDADDGAPAPKTVKKDDDGKRGEVISLDSFRKKTPES